MADIITYPENGITYDADDAAGYFASRLSGVYSAEEDFSVAVAGDLNVTVGAGQAWIHPSRWVGRSVIMKQSSTLTLTSADAARTRIDRVVLRYDAAAKKTSLLVLEGTPNSDSPVPPELTRTALIYDLCLAEITRPAGSTTISTSDISDTRADETVCGVMRDGVSGIPAAALIAELKALIDDLRTEAFDALSYYPIGSIYQSANPTSPAALFGGSWEQIASERVLMGASDAHAAGTTAEAGLPNITGSIVGSTTGLVPFNYPVSTGALYSKTGSTDNHQGHSSYSSKPSNLYMDASLSNPIYGASDTVQPAAYYVYIWRRVA